MKKFECRITQTKKSLLSVGTVSVVFMASVLEIITFELISLAGNAAKEFSKHRISPKHILYAIKFDEEFSALIDPNAVLSESGVIESLKLSEIQNEKLLGNSSSTKNNNKSKKGKGKGKVKEKKSEKQNVSNNNSSNETNDNENNNSKNNSNNINIDNQKKMERNTRISRKKKGS